MSANDDPLIEAGRWLDAKLAGAPIPKLLLVVGLGDGHLLDVLESRSPETRVLALEPDPKATRAFRERRDWSSWLATGRLVYLEAPHYRGADEAWTIFPARSEAHAFLTHPSIAAHPSPAALEAARVLKKILFGARANAAARLQFAPRYLLNSLRNLPALARGSDVRALAGAFRGIPAVVAGAGPSLDGSLAALRDAADRVLVITTDTALRPLATAGVPAPLVVGLDPGTANAQHFTLLPETPGTWLVSESALDPIASAAFGGRSFWFRVANHHPWPWYAEIGVDVGRLDVWASVLTAAFQVGVLCGCDPIVFVGADLAFTDGRPYCRGSTYEFEWALSAADGRDLRWTWDQQLARPDKVQRPDLRGGETTTTPTLAAVGDWLLEHASRSGRRVINATGAGILFGGAIQQASSLRQAISSEASVPPLTAVARRPPAHTPSADLARHIHNVRRTLDARAPQPPLDAWAEFLGDGYDPAAVAAALDDAARGLEGERVDAPRDRGAAADLAALIGSKAISPVVGRLPESITRLRLAVTGAAPLSEAPLGDGSEPLGTAARLAQAFTLLRAVHDVAAAADDLAAPFQGYAVGTPVSRHCAWPNHAGRGAQLFEGLLGNTWTSPLPFDATGSPAVERRDRVRAPESSDGPAEAVRPNTTQACALLAIEWLLCAASESKWPASTLAGFVGVLRRTAEAFHPTGRACARPDGAAVVIRLDADGRSATLRLPLPAGDPTLATLLTVASGTADPLSRQLVRIEMPGGSVAVAEVTFVQLPGFVDPALVPIVLPAPPRVLSDERGARATVSFAAPSGAVIAPMHGARRGQETVLMRADGSLEPYQSWPRPVTFTLPMGGEESVAWNHETAGEVRGCVMHRSAAGEPVRAHDLPFSPLAGTWWRGRLYWACWPTGIGSWAPGEDTTFVFPDLSLCGISGDDSGLLLEPWLVADAVPQRRPLTHGWRWEPGRAPERVPLGPYGAASCRSTRERWTAAAHPDADVVALQCAGGPTVSLVCDYPFRVAWAGESLLVGTVRGELLLFERLIDVLRSYESSG